MKTKPNLCTRRAPSGRSLFSKYSALIAQRSVLYFALCAQLLAPCFYAHAQQPGKIPRVGFLAGGSRVGDTQLLNAFWQRMTELGYIESKNIVAEYRFAEGKPQRLPNLAMELVKLNVDVIVGPGSGATAAKAVTKTIPIVMTYAGDPVGAGLVASLAHPGGNVTGLSGFSRELGGKNLELLKEAYPRINRVAVFWGQDRKNPSGGSQDEALLDDIKAAADTFRTTLLSLELRSVDDFEPAFSTIKAKRINGLVVLRSPLTATHRKKLVDFASDNRLPSIYPDKEFADAGGLMSYGVDVAELWGRAAVYVDKILKGAKSADIPVERPNKFEFVVNLKAAKQIGLTIPPNVLARADRVIR